MQKLLKAAQVMELNSQHAENKINGSNKKTNNIKILKIDDQKYERVQEF
jgi:hypothetical protein